MNKEEAQFKLNKETDYLSFENHGDFFDWLYDNGYEIIKKPDPPPVKIHGGEMNKEKRSIEIGDIVSVYFENDHKLNLMCIEVVSKAGQTDQPWVFKRRDGKLYHVQRYTYIELEKDK